MTIVSDKENLSDGLMSAGHSDEKTLFFLELYRKALTLPEKDLYEYFLDHAVNVTDSRIGFFHFVKDNQKTIVLTAWNDEALKNCNANYSTHYPIGQAGNWADSIRLKRPVIYNDFPASPNQKGLPEGHVSITRMLSFPLIEDGKVYAIFGVGNKADLYSPRDVSELDLISSELGKIMKQRRAETELRELEDRYHSLFSNMIDGFAFCQMIFGNKGEPLDFVYLEINDAFERLTGLTRLSIVGRKVSEAIPGVRKANPEIFEIYGRVALTGKPERFELFFKPLGAWLDISVYSPKKGYFVAVFENVTDRKKAEESLRASEELARNHARELERTKGKLEEKAAQVEEYATHMEALAEERAMKLKDAERMAAIGATAGMVGHDIRNPLQSIMSDIFLANSEVESLPQSEQKTNIRESLSEIEKSVDYINKIVADLQDFARPLKPEPKETNLTEVVENLLLRSSIPKKISVSSRVEKEAEKVLADPVLLRRMLGNLITNAVQAMPKGGKLAVYAYREKENVVIGVQDTGKGIPDDVKPKLFTPLFTTKSKGQGFGLAVVKRIAESLNGEATFKSKIGEGTTFIVSLPAPSKA